MSAGWHRLIPGLGAALAAALVLAACAAAPEGAPDGSAPEAPAGPQRAEDLLPDEGREFYQPEVDADTGNSVRVALLVPLTGRGERVGAALRDAAVMALFDAYDPRLDLRVYDTGGRAETAQAAAEAAVDDKARLIIGPLYADSIEAAAPVARAADIALIGFSNDRSVAGDGAYLLSFLPEQQVARVARYAYSQGLRDFAALVPSGDYGDRALQALGRALEPTRAAITRIETYPRTVDGVYEPVKRLADYDRRRAAYQAEVRALEELQGGPAAEELKRLANRETLGDVAFEAVLIPEGPPLIRTIATLLPFYEVDTGRVQVMGTMRWDGAALGSEESLVGAWYSAPAPEPVAAFEARFAQTFGAAPPRLASLGYDAMALVAVLVRDLGTDEITRADLEDPSGFQGVDGLFRFRSDGTAERGLAVLEVTEAGIDVVDPAPKSFYVLN